MQASRSIPEKPIIIYDGQLRFERFLRAQIMQIITKHIGETYCGPTCKSIINIIFPGPLKRAHVDIIRKHTHTILY